MHTNTALLLRQSLTDDATAFADLLQRMFDGHDVIAESAQGQAFRAFISSTTSAVTASAPPPS